MNSSGGFATAYPDPRVTGRVTLKSLNPLSPGSSDSLPTDLLLSLVLSKSLLALSLYIARNWLLAQGFSVWGLNAAALLFGAVGIAGWERTWETPRAGKRRQDAISPIYPILFASELIFTLLAISRTSVLRYIVLTSFATLWTRSFPMPFLSSAGANKAQGKNNAAFITFGMVSCSYMLDSLLSSDVSLLGYAYILLHLLACGQRSDILDSHFGDAQSRARLHAVGVAGSAFIGGVFFGVAWIFDQTSLPSSTSPPETLFGASAGFSLPEPTLNLLISASIFLALTYVLIDPLLSRALLEQFPSSKQVSAGWPIAAASTVLVGYVGFGQEFTVAEVAVGGLAWTAMSHLISTDPRLAGDTASSTSSAEKTPFIARIALIYRYLRSSIRTIMATRDSRRIYFFLCLNLAYMVIQMLYGIWTNSLGLISDSIHMFFDCLALGMGLFASVMATWEPNDRFTYGYSRVETLSGFANGLFLCLISIFIVFEAIQRLVDPPEMNTSQLLVVSSVGLAVNLVGMFATGHHHHGHSHGGHDHGSHGHDHGPKKPESSTQAGSGHDSHDHASHDHSSHDNHSHAGHNHSDHHHSKHDHSEHSHHDHSDHSHSEHTHASPAKHSHAGHSHNMNGVFLHVMADTLGSVGVIISTLLINHFGWTGFDPLASIFIAVLIFASVVPLVADSGRLLVLDMGEEREREVRSALELLDSIEGLSSYSSPRFWPKDPETIIGSIQLSISTVEMVDLVKTSVRKLLEGAIVGLEELSIEVNLVEVEDGAKFLGSGS